MYRVVIKNGLIIDPANNLCNKLNLVIERGQIVETTINEVVGDMEIDAKGKVVCPGFVDIHMHEDPYIEEEDRLEKSIANAMLKMGVTTAIGGNCGINGYDPEKYLDILDQRGSATNIGLFLGHAFVRNQCGSVNKYRAIEKKALNEMLYKSQKQLEAGCFGISFGMKYVPGMTEDEIIAMATLCKPKNKLVTAHIRNDAVKVFEAINEIIGIGEKLNISIQNSHIGSMAGYGQMEEVLALIESARKRGVDIKSDCYPYYAFSTFIGETTYDEGFLKAYDADYSSIQICTGKYAGQRCTKEIFDELRATAPKTITIGHFMKQADIDMALLNKHVMIASDGLLNKSQGHPRAAGTFPRYIAEFVRTGKIDLFTAIDKMTNQPAKRLKLSKKGNFTKGSDGDVVIFDLEKIKDQATFNAPVESPKGIDYVLIKGRIAVEEGKIKNDKLGKSVRHL